MPHYKCEACKARLQVSGKPAELVGDLCPACGSLLQPVADLAELVGYRSITARDGTDVAPQSEPHRRIADLLSESIARRPPVLERGDAAFNPSDGDEPAAVALALPVPRPDR